MQTAVKNRTKRRNRRTQQTQSRQPPDNYKMIDKRRKPTKPRTKRANSGIKDILPKNKPPSHETARSAHERPEPQKNNIPGRNIAESAGAARTAPNGKEEERI